MIFYGKKYNKRDEHREQALFILISQAEELRTVDKEFQEFYDRTTPNVYFSLKKDYGPPKAPIETIEEGFSEGWMKVVVHRKQYDPKKSNKVFNWMYTIFSNETLNWIKKGTNYNKYFSPTAYLNRKNNHETFDSNLLTGGNSIVHSEEPIVYTILQSELLDKMLKQAIEELLTGREAKIFVMRTFEAKKFNEIKDIMELSIGTVHREFNNAINKIKEFLKEHNFGWDDYVRSIS